MPHPETAQTITAEQIKQEYRQLKTLAERLTENHGKTIQHLMTASDSELTEAKRALALVKYKRDLLDQKLWPFESLSPQELLEQYENQKDIFKKVGLLKKLSLGVNSEERWGIVDDIYHQECPFPSFPDIINIMRTSENKDLLKTKILQGFDQMVIYPIGMKLGFMKKERDRYLYDGLVGIHAEQLRDHYHGGSLYHTKSHPNDPFTQKDKIGDRTKFDELQPVWLWGEYNNADLSGKLIYYPQAFSSDPSLHQGQTKADIVKKQGAWGISFLQNLPNIPRRPKNQDEVQKLIKGGRPQIDASGTTIQEYILEDYLTEEQKQQKRQGHIITPCPHDYLNAFKLSPLYQGERGLTPEEDLTYAILYLNRNQQVINDWEAAGSICYYLGAYLSGVGVVPSGSWRRVNRRTFLSRSFLADRGENCGVRPAVSLKLPSR